MAQGKNWILLRGLARGVGHWGSFAQKIQEKFSQDHFEFIDLPGNGSRNQEQSPLSIQEFVKDIRAHSNFVKKQEPFQILAVSLGAMIAVEWMREYPHEIKKAYLLCTSSGEFSPFYKRFLPPNYFKAFALLRAQNNEVLWESQLLPMITNSRERRDAEVLALMDYTKAYPMKVENVIRQLIAASRYQFPKRAPGEVQLLGSYGDRLVSPDCTLQIAQRWGLKAQMHPWAGHDVPIDDPHWLLEHLL